MPIPFPSPLGLKKSFGYGDRIGLATPGHLASHRGFDFAPIFAQQSIREMTRTGRSPREVISAAANALSAGGFSDRWGADADHLKTFQDIDQTSAAGFCFFTIDPSDYVENRADRMSSQELEAATEDFVSDGIFEASDWRIPYVNQSFDIGQDQPLRFSREDVERAAVKYARAIAHTARMANHLATLRPPDDYEIEVSVDETDSPTTALEHLFFGLELKRRGVTVVGLAPRFTGDFEKGIDYRGDLAPFESELRTHVGIANYCGPYKISVHSGSDKFAIYPALGRICGELLHVKTAGTSYLEALRCIARTRPDLFSAIADYCAGRFETDRATYHVSTTGQEVQELFHNSRQDAEQVFLNERAGRQLLHVTFGSVLSQGNTGNGRSFREAIREALQEEEDLYRELIKQHFDRHLRELSRG